MLEGLVSQHLTISLDDNEKASMDLSGAAAGKSVWWCMGGKLDECSQGLAP